MDFNKLTDTASLGFPSKSNYWKAILKMDISHFISNTNIQKNQGKWEEL